MLILIDPCSSSSRTIHIRIVKDLGQVILFTVVWLSIA